MMCGVKPDDNAVTDDVSSGLKLKREELENLKLEQEIKAREIDEIDRIFSGFRRVCIDDTIDGHTRDLFKSVYMKLLTSSQDVSKTRQTIVRFDSEKE